MKRNKIIWLLLALTLLLASCSSQEVSTTADVVEDVMVNEEVDSPEEDTSQPQESPAAIEEEAVAELAEEVLEAVQETVQEDVLEPTAEEPQSTSTTVSTVSDPNGILVVIDAGHQAVGNSSQEPVGPGATETKAKVSSGTTGRYTGIPEYVLTLEVSLMLEEELLARGYDVIMVRSTHDVDISNAERAQIANDNNADVFIRIHANGSDDTSVQGAFTICSTANNPYCSEVYSASRLLSECVLDGFIDTTGAKERSIWETDTMTGINWCTVPSTIIEMGFMTNQEEDEKMATEAYRLLMVQGMADGIDQYIAQR